MGNLTKTQRREIFIELKDSFEDEAAKNVYLFIDNPSGFTRWKNARLFRLVEDYVQAIDTESVIIKEAKKRRLKTMKGSYCPECGVDYEERRKASNIVKTAPLYLKV